MRVAIAGGHGKVARRLIRRLRDRGDEAVALIRRPEHADDVRGDGGEPGVCDLETATADEVATGGACARASTWVAARSPATTWPPCSWPACTRHPRWAGPSRWCRATCRWRRPSPRCSGSHDVGRWT